MAAIPCLETGRKCQGQPMETMNWRRLLKLHPQASQIQVDAGGRFVAATNPAPSHWRAVAVMPGVGRWTEAKSNAWGRGCLCQPTEACLQFHGTPDHAFLA